jgi:uncharacterized RDD family membrane protein YckC
MGSGDSQAPPPPVPQAPSAPPPPAADTPPAAPAPTGGSWQAPSPTGGFGAPVATGPAPGVSYADLVMRIIAYIIDGIIYGILFGIVFVIVGAILLAALLSGGAILALVGAVILAALSLIGSAIYFVYTWTTMRASPGQKLLSLETVNAADGATLTRDQAIRRWAYLFGPQAIATPVQLALGATDLNILSTLVSLAVLGYSIYLLYTASQSPKRQGFHDVQAATVVVKRG